VFFSFWLSHVPGQRFEGFWSLVDRSLAPGGRAFFVDSRRDGNVDGRAVSRDPYVLEESGEVQLRRVEDGTRYRVVKVFWEPADLEFRLRSLGWESEVRATRSFVYASCKRADGGR
jgi:hypothetical protein